MPASIASSPKCEQELLGAFRAGDQAVPSWSGWPMPQSTGLGRRDG